MANSEWIAVVTGAARGLGLETVRQLANKGLRTILTGRRPEAIEAALAELGPGLPVEGRQLDVSDDASVDAFFDWLAATHGRIDVLVNNAGRIYGDGGVAATGAAEIAQALDNNALSAWRTSRHALPMMNRQGHGRIVNVSSGMGALTDMGGGFAAYRISKTVLSAITRICAHEAAGDVKVNVVCPGWVRTDLGGAGASRDVESGAAGIVWAATLDADGPNGGFFRDGEPIAW